MAQDGTDATTSHDIRADELDWVREVTNASLVEPDRVLAGSTTSTLHLLRTVTVEGAERPVVLRRYDRPAVLRDRPDMASREATAIHEARSRSLGPSAPSLLGLRSQADVPLVLMSFVRGEVVLPSAIAEARMDRWLHRLASPVANTHATLPLPVGLPDWQPWLDEGSFVVPAWASSTAAWTTVVDVARLPAPRRPRDAVFLHGDWHPGNCLWEREEWTGTVDWAWASMGPAAVDVAHCRTNLALLHSPALADRFLDAYLRQCPGHRHHPWFDMADLLSMAGNIDSLLSLNAFGAALTPELLVARADRWAEHLVDGLAA